MCACLLNVDLQVVLQVLPNSWHRMEWLRKKMANTGASPSLQSIYLLSRFLSVLAPADELSTSVTTSTVFDESGPLSNAKTTCPAAPSTAATQAPLTSPSLQHPPRTGPAILAVARRPVVSPMLSPTQSVKGGSSPSMLCGHDLSSFKLKRTESNQDTDHFHRLLEESSQGKVSPFYMEDEGRNKTAKPSRALQTVEKMRLGSSYGHCRWSPELVLFVPRAACKPWGWSSHTRVVIPVLPLTGSTQKGHRGCLTGEG